MTDRERIERVIVEVLHDHGATTGLRKATERPEDCPAADAHFGTAPRILAALEAAGYAWYRKDGPSVADFDDACMETYHFPNGMTSCLQPKGHRGPHAGPFTWRDPVPVGGED